MSVLAFPPGLLRSPPIDPKTGLWSRPWLEYWQAQYDRVGGGEAMTNAELGNMIGNADVAGATTTDMSAALGTVRHALAQLQRHMALMQDGMASTQTLDRRVTAMERQVMRTSATAAWQGTLATQVDAIQKTLAMMPSLMAQVGTLTARLESLERILVGAPNVLAHLATLSRRVDALEVQGTYDA